MPLYKRYNRQNNIVTDNITYKATTFTTDNIEKYVEFYDEDETTPSYGLTHNVVEKAFSIRIRPSNYNSQTGTNYGPGTSDDEEIALAQNIKLEHPFTYLTIPLNYPLPLPNLTDPWQNTLNNAFLPNAVYVQGTVVLEQSPEGVTENMGGGEIETRLALGFTFEHFGTRAWYETQDSQINEDEKFFTSEFNVIDTLNIPAWIPTTDSLMNTAVSNIEEHTLDITKDFQSLNHPINYDYDRHEFQCKLTLGPDINTHIEIIDGTQVRVPYTAVVKGTYLLM